jgi:sugar O-acyltransferase (sialic acid O-acetyltransferase NeuD family)
MKQILLFSAGSGSREILRIIQDINEVNPTWHILGFVDNNVEAVTKKVDGFPVYRSDDFPFSKNIHGICGILDQALCKKVVETEIEANQVQLATIIHPSVIMDKETEIGAGSVLHPGVCISYNVKIGKCVVILYRAILGHDVEVGNYNRILSSTVINGGGSIGENCMIGASVTIAARISIGKNSVIGIGTTVINNIDEGKSVMAMPRQIITEIPNKDL